MIMISLESKNNFYLNFWKLAGKVANRVGVRAIYNEKENYMRIIKKTKKGKPTKGPVGNKGIDSNDIGVVYLFQRPSGNQQEHLWSPLFISNFIYLQFRVS